MKRLLALVFPLLFVTGVAFADTKLVTLVTGEEVYGSVRHQLDGSRVKAVIVTTVTGQVTTYAPDQILTIESLGHEAAATTPTRATTETAAAMGFGDATGGAGSTRGAAAPQAGAGAPNLAEHPSIVAPQVKGIQASLLSNPRMMEAILTMASDPEIAKLVRDPTLLAAIAAGDLSQVQKHPAFAKLANDPRIRALMIQVRDSQK